MDLIFNPTQILLDFGVLTFSTQNLCRKPVQNREHKAKEKQKGRTHKFNNRQKVVFNNGGDRRDHSISYTILNLNRSIWLWIS